MIPKCQVGRLRRQAQHRVRQAKKAAMPMDRASMVFFGGGKLCDFWVVEGVDYGPPLLVAEESDKDATKH